MLGTRFVKNEQRQVFCGFLLLMFYFSSCRIQNFQE